MTAPKPCSSFLEGGSSDAMFKVNSGPEELASSCLRIVMIRGLLKRDICHVEPPALKVRSNFTYVACRIFGGLRPCRM